MVYIPLLSIQNKAKRFMRGVDSEPIKIGALFANQLKLAETFVEK